MLRSLFGLSIIFFCSFAALGQSETTYFLEFDDSLRVEKHKDYATDTIDYNLLKDFTHVKVIAVNKKGDETAHQVVGGKIIVTGVLFESKIDSTGTIVKANYSDKTILAMAKNKYFKLSVKFFNGNGDQWTFYFDLYGKLE